MPRAVIDYDKDLPEIPDRRPWESPSSFLVKDDAEPTGWRIDQSGRRPSTLLLISKIRIKVDAWRKAGYPGASAVTQRLFEYWFDDDHEVPAFGNSFRYHFCQREAIETLVYLIEIWGKRDAKDLIGEYSPLFDRDLLSKNIEFQTKVGGVRQVRRYVAELEREGTQDLPPEQLRRFAFKMATGSGKTWVMAMAIVWSRFHRRLVPGSDLSTNFLIVAPNVIVYQRLEKDFKSNQIFYELPLIPPEWKSDFAQKIILRGETTEPDASANLFITNIQQLYESRDQVWTPENAVEALLGRKPAQDPAASGQRSMLERLKSLNDVLVMNDEAHHVHDEELQWAQSLLALHRALPKGLCAWLDFSATPKDQNGMYFPWTVCDYPLAQAVEDRIVKAPLIVTKEDDPKQPKKDPDNITAENIAEKYGYWLQAAVARWKEHQKAYKKLDAKPVLFVMVEKTNYAEALGKYFWQTQEFGLRESEILVIHTDTAGEITKKHLDALREAARDIDKPESKIKVIVSVMMLREGWDVRNVSVVLGLRPFSAKAEILPEQVVGRGLRLMTQVSPDRTQTLEVLGTRNLLRVVREQLEADGVGVGKTAVDPPLPVTVYPLEDRRRHDISIPRTKPTLQHNVRRLSDFDPSKLDSIFDQAELSKDDGRTLRLAFITTGTEVHQTEVVPENTPTIQESLSSIAVKTVHEARLPNQFAALYPYVRDYVATRCFGRTVDLDERDVRKHLAQLEVREAIAKYLAKKIAELTLEHRAIEFANAEIRLSETRPFQWRRNLPPFEAHKTIFNFVATFNSFERQFAQFLDRQGNDVLRFASLGTTEQGESGADFRIDYIKPSGAIGFYHPDWVVVQRSPKGEVNWIIETKGRVWEGTAAKDDAARDWCKKVSGATGKPWRYNRVNQAEYDPRIRNLADLPMLV